MQPTGTIRLVATTDAKNYQSFKKRNPPIPILNSFLPVDCSFLSLAHQLDISSMSYFMPAKPCHQESTSCQA